MFLCLRRAECESVLIAFYFLVCFLLKLKFSYPLCVGSNVGTSGKTDEKERSGENGQPELECSGL